MYFPIHIHIDKTNGDLEIKIEKGTTAEYLNTRKMCSCKFMFNVPTIFRTDSKITYTSLYHTNYSGEHSVSFKLPLVNGSGLVLKALEEYSCCLVEIQHIFEYSLYNYTTFFNIPNEYDYHCDFSKAIV